MQIKDIDVIIIQLESSVLDAVIIGYRIDGSQHNRLARIATSQRKPMICTVPSTLRRSLFEWAPQTPLLSPLIAECVGIVRWVNELVLVFEALHHVLIDSEISALCWEHLVGLSICEKFLVIFLRLQHDHQLCPLIDNNGARTCHLFRGGVAQKNQMTCQLYLSNTYVGKMLWVVLSVVCLHYDTIQKCRRRWYNIDCHYNYTYTYT